MLNGEPRSRNLSLAKRKRKFSLDNYGVIRCFNHLVSKKFRLLALKVLNGDSVRPSGGVFYSRLRLTHNNTFRLRETLIAVGASNEQIVKDAFGYDFRLCSR
jgi:hypothetical protein